MLEQKWLACWNLKNRAVNGTSWLALFPLLTRCKLLHSNNHKMSNSSIHGFYSKISVECLLKSLWSILSCQCFSSWLELPYETRAKAWRCKRSFPAHISFQTACSLSSYEWPPFWLMIASLLQFAPWPVNRIGLFYSGSLANLLCIANTFNLRLIFGPWLWRIFIALEPFRYDTCIEYLQGSHTHTLLWCLDKCRQHQKNNILKNLATLNGIVCSKLYYRSSIQPSIGNNIPVTQVSWSWNSGLLWNNSPLLHDTLQGSSQDFQ